MKAPDKIYVLPEVASVVKVLDEEVEYIRKDIAYRELTWEDMLEICATASFLYGTGHWWEKYTMEELYTEVLKRFKEYKEKKSK